MNTLTTNQMKLHYNELTKREKSLLKAIKNYNTLINSLLVEIRGIGEKLDLVSTKDTLLRFQKEKSKMEADLVEIRFEKGVLNANIKVIFSRLRESNTAEEIFESLNDKYANYAMPVQFEYQNDNSKGDINGVIFYKI